MTADPRPTTAEHFSDTMEVTKMNLMQSIAAIDSVFGKGHAAANKDLLIAYMKTASIHGLDGTLRELCDTIRESFKVEVRY